MLYRTIQIKWNTHPNELERLSIRWPIVTLLLLVVVSWQSTPPNKIIECSDFDTEKNKQVNIGGVSGLVRTKLRSS